MRNSIVSLVMALSLSSWQAFAGMCQRWSAPVSVGTLDPKSLPEASGLAVSRRFADRLYHVNDSGNAPDLYMTDTNGRVRSRIKVKGFGARDVEELSMGACGYGKDCIFLGDIGDNDSKRDRISIVGIEEVDQFPDSVTPILRYDLRYPDGAHNAESFAVHPNGDIFIVTKELSKRGRTAQPAQVFYATADELKTSGGRILTLHHLGSLDLPTILSNLDFYGQAATSMSISPDGTRFLLLTYEAVLEFAIDLGARRPWSSLTPALDYRVIPVGSAGQQEAIAYSLDARSFLFSSESTSGEAPPLSRVSCELP